MNDPLLDAVKKKRLGSGMSLPEGHGEHEEGGKDLLGLVASLSPEERMKMKDILHASDNSSDVEKGDPSSEEHGKINQAMQREAQTDQAESMNEPGQEVSDDESDDIGASMLDSKYRNGPIEGKPRGLGDRVKNSIATKLKEKGKL